MSDADEQAKRVEKAIIALEAYTALSWNSPREAEDMYRHWLLSRSDEALVMLINRAQTSGNIYGVWP